MLETVEVDSWDEFEEIIRTQNRQQVSKKIDAISQIGPYSPTLFRGQPDSEFGLDTTLERVIGKNKRVYFYLGIISKILPEIEAFIGKKWDINDSDLIKETNSYLDMPEELTRFPLGYMTYLRHFGFPSPLLDWSFSPFVAAYFAFRNLASEAKSVAIFQYQQVYNHSALQRKRSIITPLPIEDVQNNQRHYLQQSIYTICVNSDTEIPYFSPHESVYEIANEVDKFKDYDKGEFLKKYVLPASERENALLNLELHNINSFSLMGSEESLLETLFIRHASPFLAFERMYPGYRDYLSSQED